MSLRNICGVGGGGCLNKVNDQKQIKKGCQRSIYRLTSLNNILISKKLICQLGESWIKHQQ